MWVWVGLSELEIRLFTIRSRLYQDKEKFFDQVRGALLKIWVGIFKIKIKLCVFLKIKVEFLFSWRLFTFEVNSLT